MPRGPDLIVMLVSCCFVAAVLVRAGETETLDGAVERVAEVVRVDWEVLLRTERLETDRREEAAETLEGRGET